MFNFILIAVGLYAAYATTLYFSQRAIMFPGQNLPPASLQNSAETIYEQHWLEMSFGKVECWYISARDSSQNRQRFTIIFAHGNYELIDLSLDEALLYSELGLDVLLVEFPGYGRSQGKPGQNSIRETFVAAYDWIRKEKKVESQHIILFGRSVGGGAVCDLATQRQAAALILQSTFTSVRDMAKRYFVPGVFVRDPFDNLQAVQSFQGPILIFHGLRDDLIPYHHAVVLSQQARAARLISYPCGHNDLPPNWTTHLATIAEFVKSLSQN